MNKYKVTFETGPTHADCHEIMIEADTVQEASQSFEIWIRAYHPEWLNRVMITSVKED